MNLADLERDLAEGALRPVYLFHGQETLLKERYLDQAAASVPEGLADLNLQKLLADETPAGEAAAQARTMPFMGERRVIILSGVDRYPADELAPLLGYIKDPNESTCLVLVADKPDFRLKFFKAIKDKGLDVAFEAPRGGALVPWVREAMGRRGQEMSPEAARTLIDRVGTDLMELDQELEKVSLYALGQKSVGVDEVKAASRLGPTASVFELGDALGEQNPDRALSALKDLLQTQHHLPILTMMVRHFRLLLKAKLFEGGRGSKRDAAASLGVHPYYVKNYLNQARGLGLAQIKKGLARLLAANLTLVTSSAPERLVMESLVLDLASLRPKGRPGL